MNSMRRILVTLDQSKESEAILYYLPGVLRLGDEVLLMTVASPPPSVSRSPRDPTLVPMFVGTDVVVDPPLPPYSEDREQATERRRAELIDYLEDRGLFLRNEGFQTKTHVAFSEHPADAIIATAHEVGALMVAMSTRARSGVDRIVFGSVAEAVVRSRVAPVLLIRS